MKNLRELLREQILKFDGNDHEIEMDDLNVEEWPEEDGEAVDMENWRISHLDEDVMIMVAGGDWQEGAVMEIRSVDGKLRVTRILEDVPAEELSESQIIEYLNS